MDPGIVLYRTKTRRTFPLACMYAPVERSGRRKNRKRGKKMKRWKDVASIGRGKECGRQLSTNYIAGACFYFSNVRVQRDQRFHVPP